MPSTPHKHNPPTVFVLDDNRHLVDKIRSCAKHAGWQCVSAHHIEEGLKLLSSPDAPVISLALIDLMLPQDAAALEQVDSCQASREQIMHEATQNGSLMIPTRKILMNARLHLAQVGRESQQFIVDDGGFQFLQQVRERGLHRNWKKAVVFSARDVGNPEIMNKANKLGFEDDMIELLQKPVSPDAIEKLFQINT